MHHHPSLHVVIVIVHRSFGLQRPCHCHLVGALLVVGYPPHPLSLSVIMHGRRVRQISVRHHHHHLSPTSSHHCWLMCEVGKGIVIIIIHPSHPCVVIGYHRRWVKACGSVFGVNRKGGWEKTLVRELSSSSIPHVLVLSALLSSSGGVWNNPKASQCLRSSTRWHKPLTKVKSLIKSALWGCQLIPWLLYNIIPYVHVCIKSINIV